MSDALVIIDMQAGSFGPADPPRYDIDGLIGRLNALSRWVRSRAGLVIWVCHNGEFGDALEPATDGWRVLSALEQDAADQTIGKTACDGFLDTPLEAILRERNTGRVIIGGWATDFCVDTTVRASTGRGFNTWAAADGHTTSDRPHLAARRIIEHHNYVWAGLIAPGGPVTVANCQALMSS
jgi:nicotinamidase-related amidase